MLLLMHKYYLATNIHHYLWPGTKHLFNMFNIVLHDVNCVSFLSTNHEHLNK